MFAFACCEMGWVGEERRRGRNASELGGMLDFARACVNMVVPPCLEEIAGRVPPRVRSEGKVAEVFRRTPDREQRAGMVGMRGGEQEEEI